MKSSLFPSWPALDCSVRPQAYDTYEFGARKGIFLSKYQRSLYNVPRLTAKPWWTPEETGSEEMLQVGGAGVGWGSGAGLGMESGAGVRVGLG